MSIISINSFCVREKNRSSGQFLISGYFEASMVLRLMLMFESSPVGLMVSLPSSSENSSSPSGIFFSTSISLSQNTVVEPGIIVLTSMVETKVIFPSVVVITSVSPEFSNRTLLDIEREFFWVEKFLAYSISCLIFWHWQLNFMVALQLFLIIHIY